MSFQISQNDAGTNRDAADSAENAEPVNIASDTDSFFGALDTARRVSEDSIDWYKFIAKPGYYTFVMDADCSGEFGTRIDMEIIVQHLNPASPDATYSSPEPGCDGESVSTNLIPSPTQIWIRLSGEGAAGYHIALSHNPDCPETGLEAFACDYV